MRRREIRKVREMRERKETIGKSLSKGLRNISLMIALLIGVGVTHWVYQYYSGESIAGGGNKDVNELYGLFKGAESQTGEINVLLIGSDARGSEQNARSDSLMVAHYNRATREVKIVSIMRDTYVGIPGYGQHRINAAFSLGGPELVRKTVKENFGVDANYYAIADFKGFPKIMDAVAPNGIEVDIKTTMSHGIGMELKPGVQTLQGEELLGYVRYRNDSRSDFGRVERQQEVLTKMKEQAISIQSIVGVPKTLGVISSYVDTNLDKRTLVTIGKGLLTAKSQGMETMRVPVENSFTDKRVAGAGLVLSIDLEKNKQAIQNFLTTTESKEGE